MKVNITGKGRVPGVNKPAPIENIELSQIAIGHIIKIRSFRVFTVDGNIEITKNNISDVFSGKVKAPEKVEAPVVEEKKVEVKPEPVAEEVKVEEPVIEEPVVTPEVTEEAVAQSFVEDVAAVEDQLPEKEDSLFPIEETDVEAFDEKAEDEVAEEATEETEKPKTNKKKRNRK